MDTKEITDRLWVLHNALIKDTLIKESEEKDKKPAFFTQWERISINQERGYLLSLLSSLYSKVKPLRRHKVSPAIEAKIKKTAS